ncbi:MULTISPECIES: adenosylmethionine--8-amino-7-oxononanoate transaminase [Holospora]|uniref:Adenosylmethionine-8-amino-7-oxononanoate aminotransferase n=2 Tax=Holospora TaxID=44747 RepID=A0A061JFM9_9PROT|nr:adenosylmethionine--8-amino-7-oxononanoate transaminase [Holospora undulata]ETZ04446.1 adenosylmethionine-8-amino-7-oxononanoate aminotransferase [Holospora undulata HU1]GAJ46112.1 adenosylmethionine-8-amino-7-oxononanoate aminotransferase [Holospora elegans E1]
MSLSKRDKELIWHPFTQEEIAPEVIALQRGNGAYLYDKKGKAYLDLISSWWVNLHGHCHPVIAERIYQQALKLEHVLFAGFTHEPAVTLCEALQKILPQPLCRFFFSDNGSTAVEVALKMAYQFWKNKNQFHRKTFLSFKGGYHGDTVGAMSAGIDSGFHSVFSELCFAVDTIPYPETWDHDPDVVEKEADALCVLEKILTLKGDQISAIIIEPILQGASGMRLARPQFINACIAAVRKYQILVIFDEVMTGFCRTGPYFAFSHTEVIPDFLCLSKGITGGFLPLALTVTTGEVYTAFLSKDWKDAFAHGHSYTANPLACAAAVGALELLQSSHCQRQIQVIITAQRQGISFLKQKNLPISKLRSFGTMGAFDLNSSQESIVFQSKCLKEGLIVRPLKTTVYTLPPYVITQEELKECYEIFARIIETC